MPATLQNPTIALLVLSSMKNPRPDEDNSIRNLSVDWVNNPWKSHDRAWVYLVLAVNKELSLYLDQDQNWEQYFKIKCDHLTSPHARFRLMRHVQCKYSHPYGIFKPSIAERYSVNIQIVVSNDIKKSFARQAIPQFLTAKHMIYHVMQPFDLPSAEFTWIHEEEEEDYDETNEGSQCHETSEDEECAQEVAEEQEEDDEDSVQEQEVEYLSC